MQSLQALVGVVVGSRPFSCRILHRISWHRRGLGVWCWSWLSWGDVRCRFLLLFVLGFGGCEGGGDILSLVSSSVFVIVACIVTGWLWIVL